MDENYKQSLTFHIAAINIVDTTKRLGNLASLQIASDDEAKNAINHIITFLGLRSDYLDSLEIEIWCASAKYENGEVSFTVVGESTESPSEHATGWKGCANYFNESLRKLQNELKMKSGDA